MIKLEVVESAIVATFFEEFGVGADFFDATIFEDDDLIGLKNRGEAMGDGDDRAAFGEEIEGALDFLFGLGIEGTGGFIEEENRGVFEEGAGDGKSLLLTTGEVAAFVADDRFVAVGLEEDEVVSEGLAGGRMDLGFGGVEATIADIFGDGGVEEECFLSDDAYLFAERGLGDGADIDDIDKDGATLRIVEAEEEREERAFAGAASADEGAGGAGGDVELDGIDGWGLGTITEGDVGEFDGTADGAEGWGLGLILDGGFEGEEFEDSGRGGETFLHLAVDLAELFDGVIEHESSGEKSDKFRGGSA